MARYSRESAYVNVAPYTVTVRAENLDNPARGPVFATFASVAELVQWHKRFHREAWAMFGYSRVADSRAAWDSDCVDGAGLPTLAEIVAPLFH